MLFGIYYYNYTQLVCAGDTHQSYVIDADKGSELRGTRSARQDKRDAGGRT